MNDGRSLDSYRVAQSAVSIGSFFVCAAWLVVALLALLVWFMGDCIGDTQCQPGRSYALLTICLVGLGGFACAVAARRYVLRKMALRIARADW